jgi:hypothetical protein
MVIDCIQTLKFFYWEGDHIIDREINAQLWLCSWSSIEKKNSSLLVLSMPFV